MYLSAIEYVLCVSYKSSHDVLNWWGVLKSFLLTNSTEKWWTMIILKNACSYLTLSFPVSLHSIPLHKVSSRFRAWLHMLSLMQSIMNKYYRCYITLHNHGYIWYYPIGTFDIPVSYSIYIWYICIIYIYHLLVSRDLCRYIYPLALQTSGYIHINVLHSRVVRILAPNHGVYITYTYHDCWHHPLKVQDSIFWKPYIRLQ